MKPQRKQHPVNQHNQEVELKLMISPAEVDKLCRHPLLDQFAAAKPYTQKMTSTYFDTPDFQIKQHGASLRVRQLESGAVQTLKGDDKSSGGLHRRNEWEGHIDNSSPDLSSLHDMLDKHTQLRKILRSPSLDSHLHPIFDTRVTRTVWELKLPDGSEIEFSLDQGAIEHQDLREQISEVELELKSGQPKNLFDFASQLLDVVPMRIGHDSKADRGYSLCSPSTEKPTAVKAKPIELSEDMTAESAFKTILTNCLAHIQGNPESVIQSDDPESVHQMRVGMRRLHSALRLFKDIVPVPASLQEELDWLASQLDPARDWEVLSASTLSWVENVLRNEAGLAALHKAANDIAREKRDQAAEAVKSSRYTKLMLTLSGWLEAAEWRNAMLASKRKNLDWPVHRFADKMLAEDEDRLKKRGKVLRGADVQQRHRTRIAAKKMRYAMEFFQSLYPSGRVQRYVKSLSTLQDKLGWLNDAAVADRLLHDFEKDHQELANGIGFARGYLMSTAENKARKLNRIWKRFEPLKAPC